MPDTDRVSREKQRSNIAEFVSNSVSLFKAQVKDPARPFAVLVRFRVREGTQERCEAAFAAARTPTRNEKGCLAFDLNRDAADETCYVTYERWKSLADLENHLQTPYIASLIIDLLEILAGPPEFQVLAALEARTDFRLPTASKWRAPRAVADGIGGMILARADVAGSPEQACRALTTDEVEEWWKFPGVYGLRDWKADLRVGGRWSVTVELNDGNVAHHWGEFCELDLPNKIVMTSRSDAHPLLGERETTITYRLEPIAGGTRLTVRDEGFIGRAEAAHGNAENWERVLGWLAAYIGHPIRA